MKIFHLIKEDLKHVAWLLLLYVGVVLAYAYPGSGFADSVVESEAGFSLLRHVTPYLIVLYGLVATLLISRLMSKDGLCDVDAFWLSKPIDGRELLVSKLAVLLVVYFVIPMAVLWLVVGSSGVGMPWGAFVRYGYWALWFVPVVVFFAVHTRGLSAMMVGVVAFAATVGLGYNFFQEILRMRPAMGGVTHLSAYMIFLVSVLLGIALPFLRRRVALSRWIAGMGVLVAASIPLVSNVWYVGFSEQAKANELLKAALEVKEPQLRLRVDEARFGKPIVAQGSLEFGNVPDGVLFHVVRTRLFLPKEGGRPVVVTDDRVNGFVSASTLRRSLLESLKKEDVWDFESLKTFKSSRVDFESRLKLEGEKEGVEGSGVLLVDLARYQVENVAVSPIIDGAEIEFGGIRSVLKQTGEAADYSKYMVIEYKYNDLAADPPIQFSLDDPSRGLYRIYLLRGKSGSIWSPSNSLINVEFAEVFGLVKGFRALGEIVPLTEGAEDEELELLAIDVRYLGSLQLRLGATAEWQEGD